MPGVPSLHPYGQINKDPPLFSKFHALILSLIVFAGIFIFSPQNVPTLVSIKSTHPDFVGRKDVLAALKKELVDNKQSFLSTAVLWGEGGLGKTETAIAFANTYVHKFSLIHSIDCGSPEIYRNSYLKLADQLNIAIDQKDPLEKIRQRIYNYFHTLKNRKPWLLIFDNVEDSLELPERGNGRIIITSRSKPLFQSKLCLQLPYFSDEEALLLVRSILSKEAKPLCKDLIKELGYLPLVLNQLTHYLKNIPERSIEDYLSIIKANAASLLDKLPPDYRYCRHLTSALQCRNQSLFQKSPDAYHWLAICAYLHPDHIPSEWIESWFNSKTEEQKDLYQIKYEANQLRRQLVQEAHMRYNEVTKSFSFHRLKQDIIKSDTKLDQQEIQKEVLKLLAFPIKKISKLDNFDWQIEQWHEPHYWEINATWFLERSEINFVSPDLLLVINGLIKYYTVIKGDYQKSLYYFDLACKLQNSCKTDLSFSTLSYSIGYTLFCLGKYQKAIELYEKSLEISKKISEEDNAFEIALFLKKLGNCYNWLGDYEKSHRYLEESYDILLKLYPNTPHFQVADVLKWLGAPFDKGEDYTHFLEYSFKALEMNKVLFGEMPNLQRAYIAGNLGTTYRKMNNAKEGLKWHKESWAIAQEIYKKNINLHSLMIIKDISSELFYLKKYKKSIQWSEKGLKIASQLFDGEPHLMTALIFRNLAKSYSELNCSQKALDYENKCQEILDEIAKENVNTSNLSS